MQNKMELLSPAGSIDALKAAVSAGADAVYFGSSLYNARINAKNLTKEEIIEAVKYCHIVGVKTYMTVNTQLYDDEIIDCLNMIVDAHNIGVDAFIIADLGLAYLIKKYYSQIEIHASTQMTNTNQLSSVVLEKVGFSRMVAPRELSMGDLKIMCEKSNLEIEAFVHGALCVSFSGQCLLSSVIGGRSGNRGSCAQPCRLNYKSDSCEYNTYLSLKDLCLANHIVELSEMGVSSLKIEGRMKSPEYVYGVTKIYRKLIDENRNANENDLNELKSIFSRNGFTSCYFDSNISHSMVELNASGTKRIDNEMKLGKIEPRRLPVSFNYTFKENELKIVATAKNVAIEKVFNFDFEGYSPLSKEKIIENASKLGATFYKVENIIVDGEEFAKMPISQINSFRREIVEELDTCLMQDISAINHISIPKIENDRTEKNQINTAYFVDVKKITPKSKEYFDTIFVGLDDYLENEFDFLNIGVYLPPITLDTELENIVDLIKKSYKKGCKKYIATNLWQIDLLNSLGVEYICDTRLNSFNNYSIECLKELGASAVLISIEQGVHKIDSSCKIGTISFGKIPIMTLEKCVIKELNGSFKTSSHLCHYCDKRQISYIEDRMNTKFPIIREKEHRNVIFNSVPVYNYGFIQNELYDIHHSIFVDEKTSDIDDVIFKMENGIEYSKQHKKLKRVK